MTSRKGSIMGDMFIVLGMSHLVVAAAAYVFGHHKGSGFMLQQLDKQLKKNDLDRQQKGLGQ